MVLTDVRGAKQEQQFTHQVNQLQQLLIDGAEVSHVSRVLNFGIEDNSPETVQTAQAFIELACTPLQALNKQYDPTVTHGLLRNPIVVHFFTESDWVHNPNIRFIANTVRQAVQAAEEGKATINSAELHSPASCQYFCNFCYKVTEPELSGIYTRARDKKVKLVDEDFWHQFIIATLASRGEEANKTIPFTILQSGCADTEPTLVPFFSDFLSNSKQRVKDQIGEETAELLKHDVYTIGIALKIPQVRDALLKHADHIRVSIFSPDPKEYGQISGLNVNAFNNVMRGVEALIEERKKQGSPAKITSSYLVTPENYKSLKQMLELYAKLGIDALDLRSIHGETREDLTSEQQAETARILRDIYTHRDTFPFRINFGYTAASLALGVDGVAMSTLSPNEVDMQMLNKFHAGPSKLTLTQGGVLLGFSPGVEGGNFISDEMGDSPFSIGRLDMRDADEWPLLMNSLATGLEASVNNSSVRALGRLDVDSQKDQSRVRRITTGSILTYQTLAAIAEQPLDTVRLHPYLLFFKSGSTEESI